MIIRCNTNNLRVLTLSCAFEVFLPVLKSIMECFSKPSRRGTHFEFCRLLAKTSNSSSFATVHCITHVHTQLQRVKNRGGEGMGGATLYHLLSCFVTKPLQLNDLLVFVIHPLLKFCSLILRHFRCGRESLHSTILSVERSHRF